MLSIFYKLGTNIYRVYVNTIKGIEDERQSDLLKTFSCDFGQGYLFGKPMPKEEFLELAKRF